MMKELEVLGLFLLLGLASLYVFSGQGKEFHQVLFQGGNTKTAYVASDAASRERPRLEFWCLPTTDEMKEKYPNAKHLPSGAKVIKCRIDFYKSEGNPPRIKYQSTSFFYPVRGRKLTFYSFWIGNTWYNAMGYLYVIYEEPTTTTTLPESGIATLSCYVRDKTNGRPIRGAICRFHIEQPEKITKECRTGSDGWCRLPGSYRLTKGWAEAIKEGYERATESIRCKPGYTCGIAVNFFLKPVCKEGWLDEYRCYFNILQRKWKLCPSGYEWRDYKNCDELDTFVGDRYCKGNAVVQKFRDYYCHIDKCEYQEYEKVIEECEYGCENGECLPGPTPPTPPTDIITRIIQDLLRFFISILVGGGR